jgi:hypothetical protein
LPKDDEKAQEEIVEQLFAGENFCFGSPIEQFKTNLQGTL